jgi:hypothetical protein
MQGELATILSPIDLTLRWYMPEEERPGDKTWVRAVFLKFHGSCASAGSPRSIREQAEPLGVAETEVSAGIVLPYSQMDCDRLRSVLAAGERPRPGEERRLGIAMGRLVAHELYHVLLQTTGHSQTGIAQAICSPASLLALSFRFEADELERIRTKYALAPRLHIASVARPALPGKESVAQKVVPQKTTFTAN